MPNHSTRHLLESFRPIVLLTLLVLLALPQQTFAQESPVVQETPAALEKSFPGLNEIIPQATLLATRVAEAEAKLQQAENLEDVYARLDENLEALEKLEEQYSFWEEANNWQFNRLLSARISYADLKDQQDKSLDKINEHLKTLEKLHKSWEQESTYWKEWQDDLRKTGVKLPRGTFTEALNSIDALLKLVTDVSGTLLKAQQKYSPAQVVLANRLSVINKTMDDLRRDSFRRNTYSLFEADYYNQFDRELFSGFVHELSSYIYLPDGFFTRHLWIICLQFISIISILLFLDYRKKSSKALNEEWAFMYRRPLAGAVFMTLTLTALMGDPYSDAPLIWKLLTTIISIIAGIRLLDVIYPQPLTRKAIRFIATLFIVTETFQVFGLPAPLMQIYQILLCAITIPICYRLIHQHRQGDKQLWLGVYLGGAVAVISLVTVSLGFATLTTNLIDATLSTFIIIIMLKMVLRFADGGIKAIMDVAWVKNRKFMQALGVEEATGKIQTLLRIIVLVNAAFFLLVVWRVFDNLVEARDTFLGYQYSFGEFSFSVEMVIMVVVVLYLTTLFSWVIQAFVESQIMTPRKMDVGVRESLKRLIHYALFTFGFLVAASMAGLDLQKFTILAGALGVGIGFGLQNIVNNFVSGLILLFERPVKIGDTITIDQEWGTISKIGLRSTVVETFDRSEIIVPNADLISQRVTNWTFSSKIVRVNLPVGVAYGSPLEKVLKILNRAAREHPDVLSYPEPNSVFDSFGNSSIDFTLRFWIHSVDDRFRVRSDVAVIIDRMFREEDITIPFPQQDLHLRSIDSKLQAQFGAPSPQVNPSAEEATEEAKE